MDDLLCDEVWLSSSLSTHETKDHKPLEQCSCYENDEEFEQAFAVCLEKENFYMLEPDYVKYLESNNLIFARGKAIQWFIKCKSRFSLSLGTVFYAVSYLDRFVSISQCNDWEYWMVELLSIACLYIASKFNETRALSLVEIQMEGLEYTFQSSTFLKMEVILLKALRWHLNPLTTYSIVEMLIFHIESLRPQLYEKLISQVAELLLQATLDKKMLEFRKSIVGISALRCILDQLLPSISDSFIASIMRHLNQTQKDDLIKCHRIMETHTLMGLGHFHYFPSSPTTVLLKEHSGIYDFFPNGSLCISHGSDINDETIKSD
ncbi:hypothetical protein L6164_000518 [Bauhinia variegata]|uniref:Uncharacterized protein n=1 Tax=Bauhinia variegata TaxID=167791 RepID=A0ACB9Q6X1_BAUVA|nr:hypothetical protein L6164_000518 [Bauhinia variegata]